jgi:SAM-dependent methyltransferase
VARRSLTSRLSGIADLERRMADLEADIRRLETQLHESREEGWERSRRRWRVAAPDARLTWGAELTGDAFVEKAAAHGAFGPGKAVLEVGPGYGRLLRTAIERGDEFGSWTGVDLSAQNVRHLIESFERPGIRFVHADAEKVLLDEPVDAMLSSLTFKHLFPSFERVLVNVSGQMRPGAVVLFDLIEGDRRYFERDGVTYIRWYTRPEIEAILERAGLEPPVFDVVHHHRDASRLLVVARKPA